MGVSAFAGGNERIKYWDGNTEKTSTDICTHVEQGSTIWGDGTTNTKWYVVQGSVELTSRIKVNGNVALILADGAQLDAKGGINVAQGNSLTIYGQKESTGKLVADIGESEYNAAIGGNEHENSGNITIAGGTVTASLEYGKGAAIGGGSEGTGNVTITGGIVTATNHEGNGAGIGGGNAVVGNVTINGGTVRAASFDGAGIGGGRDAGETTTIIINGGGITANSIRGAGIGGGSNEAGNVTINGGTITANSNTGAGIGGGDNSPGNVTINGGTITANSNTGAGIGGGSGETGNVTIKGGTVSAKSTHGAGIGGGQYAASAGTFNTDDGKALIYASSSSATSRSISNQSDKTNWRGIIFEKNEDSTGYDGAVYGNQKLNADLEVNENQKLTVSAGKTLEIPKGKTLTVKGKLVNQGTLENKGKIKVFGEIEGNGEVKGNAPMRKPFKIEFTAPTPKEGLTYIGRDQELIDPGAVADESLGKMKYSLSENGTYIEAIPKGKYPGTYQVYYKIEGTNVDYDYQSAKGSVEVSIEKGSSGKRQNSGDSSTTTPVHPGAPTVTVKNEAAKELVKNITDQAQANHVDTLVGNAPMTEKKAALRGLSADTKAKLTAVILAKYTDVKPGEWYSEDLAMMLLAGLVKGTSETTISPQKQVTGEEMMTMLVRSMGKEPALIAGANWYAPYKAEAKALKLDEGIKFDVAKNMTRGEVATMMFTYVKLSEKSPVAIDANALANVKDAEAIPADYKEAVSYMYQKGLLKGYEDGSFKPGKDVSRIEAISILARLVAL